LPFKFPIPKARYTKEGKNDFKITKKHSEINKSPTPKPKMTQEQIKLSLEFYKKELLIHIKNENHRMIAYKKEEIKDLEKKLL